MLSDRPEGVGVGEGNGSIWGASASHNGKGGTFLGALPDSHFVALAFNMISYTH